MAEIHKKINPEYFEKILSGEKTFEFRVADFECKPGDILVLEEWEYPGGVNSVENRRPTGRVIRKKVGYVGYTKDFTWLTERPDVAADYERLGAQIISLLDEPKNNAKASNDIDTEGQRCKESDKMTPTLAVLYAGFGGKSNSSGIVLEKIDCPEKHKILLKNSFITAPRQIQQKIIDNEYDVVVLLGSAPKIKGSTFCLETTGRGETSYTTNFQYEKLAEELEQLGHKVIVSDDAGRYLCNNVYYHTLKTANEQHLKCKVIFVHIPQSKCISNHEQMADSLGKAIKNLELRVKNEND